MICIGKFKRFEAVVEINTGTIENQNYYRGYINTCGYTVIRFIRHGEAPGYLKPEELVPCADPNDILKELLR